MSGAKTGQYTSVEAIHGSSQGRFSSDVEEVDAETGRYRPAVIPSLQDLCLVFYLTRNPYNKHNHDMIERAVGWAMAERMKNFATDRIKIHANHVFGITIQHEYHKCVYINRPLEVLCIQRGKRKREHVLNRESLDAYEQKKALKMICALQREKHLDSVKLVSRTRGSWDYNHGVVIYDPSPYETNKTKRKIVEREEDQERAENNAKRARIMHHLYYQAKKEGRLDALDEELRGRVPYMAEDGKDLKLMADHTYIEEVSSDDEA